MNFFQFFTDPVLRGPTIGSMLMCLVAAWVGVLVFVRKRSLLGEALSHATYPGGTCAILFAGFFSLDLALPFLILLGAFLSSLVGFWVIENMEKKLKVASDSALAVVLSLFFGIGVTVSSFAQNSYAHLYRQMQSYLFGQAATMTDKHILIYGVLALLVLFFIVAYYRESLVLSFDRQFAQTGGRINKILEFGLFFIIVLTLVIGVRCVGVILMSAMLIAPAAAARQFTNRFSHMFVLAGFFGSISAFFGVYCSVVLPRKMMEHYSIPTGPMIVLVSGSIALYALFFAPRRGLLSRYVRIARFREVCVQENLLKALWRLRMEGRHGVLLHEIAKRVGFSHLYLLHLLYRLGRKQAVAKKGKFYS